MMELPLEDRQTALAKHNLHASFAELRRVKQAVVEGRLWELLEARAHAHPSLLQAVKRLKKYEKHMERYTPATKKRGLFFFSSLGLMRPEIVRYRRLFEERFSPPKEAEILILLPRPSEKPFHKARAIRRLMGKIRRRWPKKESMIHVCVYAAPFGVVPPELDEVYPLSQHEIALPPDVETIDYVAERVKAYLEASRYRHVILVEDLEIWKGKICAAATDIPRKDLSTTVLRVRGSLDETILSQIVDSLQRLVD